ncbi:ABC transporter [Corynebacterium sp. NML98-0116]|uniref:ABC-F family ATP-binding cassette domain-containing protein n=1 Tax=Corynebacterium pseudogenitalium TaxID=38303 RepID=A0ABD4TMT6_9CORY|nr:MULTISPECIES: ABC-F family ATP-binding cassette domain-containing protein [unclassified Corynebacterium]MCQ4607878.1 ABC-F family ATP-binding cassette domain-containing protein [Corynebacterium pseudogenitalium]MCQ4609170.1 ABC-F family ATP-binding cassette domain-containing protein [Corynebacterium sp. CCUG 61414]AOX05575.1 ABC transporter [Corynebacterium sp. NML98-0116]MCQ4613217.1 ABC-F family ATP-binding cassette domain-containing protein [Corynebacterium pseudogenitalium]MDK8243902.1 
MIVTNDLEVRVGARTLLEAPGQHLRVQPGDRIGLVGRNGAGKTTTMRILAGETEPYAGTVTRTGEIGYLPQDSKEGNIEQSARDRVLSARGLDQIQRSMDRQRSIMEESDGATRDKAIEKFSRLEEQYHALGGYEANAEAAQICDNLGLPARVLDQQLSTLSGGQRRRVELAQILFASRAGSGKSQTTLLLDEPTNHLDADSITWLRSFLSKHDGGLIMISHDVELLEAVCNKIWFLDAVRAEADVYNMGFKKYQDARALDEARRRRERANAEKKASALQKQAAKLGAKATKAAAAKQMLARAERMMGELDDIRVADKVASISFPKPAPCGKTPLFGKGLTKMYGSLEVFAGVDLAVDKGSRVVVLGTNGAGKTTLLKLLAGVERTDGEGGIVSGHGLKIGYFAQEHDTIDGNKTVWENTIEACPDAGQQDLRGLLGAFMFSGDKLDQPAGTLSGGEKTRLALATLVSSRANVLLLDEPTNNLDPQSRQQVLDALKTYTGAVVLVTHDPGAVEALEPERVIIMPEGDEDLWSDEYMEIVELA